MDKITEGEFMFGNCEITLIKYEENWFQIDRVYVREEDRNKGALSNGLKLITQIADKDKIRLSASLLPEIDSDFPKLRKAFASAGFIADVNYRNDVDRKPNPL